MSAREFYKLQFRLEGQGWQEVATRFERPDVKNEQEFCQEIASCCPGANQVRVIRVEELEVYSA